MIVAVKDMIRLVQEIAATKAWARTVPETRSSQGCIGRKHDSQGKSF